VGSFRENRPPGPVKHLQKLFIRKSFFVFLCVTLWLKFESLKGGA
jgi:hypothetical protein